MIIKNILICIGLCIVTLPHTYTMDLQSLELQPLLELEPLLETNDTETENYYSANAQHPFFTVPIGYLDKIIFSNPPQTIGALKNTCRYLASRASLLKLTPELMPYFIIPENEKITFFKRITNLDNPEFIQKILEYEKWKSHKIPKNATIIDFDEQDTEILTLQENGAQLTGFRKKRCCTIKRCCKPKYFLSITVTLIGIMGLGAAAAVPWIIELTRDKNYVYGWPLQWY